MKDDELGGADHLKATAHFGNIMRESALRDERGNKKLLEISLDDVVDSLVRFKGVPKSI